MPLSHVSHIVTAEQAGRIDRVVREVTGRSWSDVRGLFYRRCVTLNGGPCLDVDAEVAPDDVVEVRHDPGRRYHAPAAERPATSFRLVYEDGSVLVVDKPAGLLTVPTDRGERHTLVEVITRHLKRRHPRASPGVVHRLDRETSGLLVFGVNRKQASALQEQFRQSKPLREYVAIVAGTIATDSGTFESRLATTRSLQRYSVAEDEEGELATTHYEVERRLPGATLVRATLETGRRNQIRVHFSEAGHPVLGDDRYRPDLAQHRHWKSRRLALHATRLGFQHPVTGEPLEFTSPLPTEFERFLAVPSATDRTLRD